MKMKKAAIPLALSLLLVLSAVRPLRLHVIANSDTQYDQTVKLAVRDAVLSVLDGRRRRGKLRRSGRAGHRKRKRNPKRRGRNAQGIRRGVFGPAVSGKLRFPRKGLRHNGIPRGALRRSPGGAGLRRGAKLVVRDLPSPLPWRAERRRHRNRGFPVVLCRASSEMVRNKA